MVVCEAPALLQRDDLCATLQGLEPTLRRIFSHHRLPAADYDGVRQDTFVKIYSVLANPEHTVELDYAENYTLRVFKRTCVDRYRRNRVRKHLSDEGLETLLPSSEETPLVSLEHDEQDALLRDALAQLPEHYRTAVALRYFEGLSYDEIAISLHTNPTTVSTRLFRAKQLLAKALDREFVL